MEVSTFKCDECGRLKQETNHWFRATAVHQGFVIVAWDFLTVQDGRALPIVKRDGRALPEIHLCGMECAVKAMTKAMEGGE
jgi:hypothetical protein